MPVTVETVFRSKAEKKVIDAGYDPARLPPGQYLTEKWPVLHAGSIPDTQLETWDFRVWGEVERELTLDWEQFTSLTTVEVTQDIHCVTRWSKFDMTFKGVAWRELEALVGPKPSAQYAVAHAEQGFTANVPIESSEPRARCSPTRRTGNRLHPSTAGRCGS